MTINNKLMLIGNMGNEVKIVDTTKTRFATVSIATTDSYKDDNEEWQECSPVWHQVITFNPKLIKVLNSLKKGSRIQLEGSLSYLPKKVNIENSEGEMKEISLMQTSIIANKIELAPLTKSSS